MLNFTHDYLEVELSPGELWVHIGQRPLELFPPNLVLARGDAFAAKKQAIDENVVVLLELRASGSALRSAQRNAGLFDIRDVPHAAAHSASLITTGFVTGQGVVIGFIKNRDGLLPLPFVHYPRNRTLLWDLLGQHA